VHCLTWPRHHKTILRAAFDQLDFAGILADILFKSDKSLKISVTKEFPSFLFFKYKKGSVEYPPKKSGKNTVPYKEIYVNNIKYVECVKSLLYNFIIGFMCLIIIACEGSRYMRIIDGGVTAPEGFFATGVACGIKKDGKKDLAIVCSEDIAAAAGVFTTNLIKGHSLQVTMEHISNGYAIAIIINSGNANACVGEQGYRDAKEIAEIAANLLECYPEDILVGSTGVIGVPLNMDAVRIGIEKAVEGMDPNGGHDAEEAIKTTDLISKEIAVETEIQGEKVIIGGMAKGSGMIHPNMATMVGIITSDINISRSLLDKALKDVARRTFNRVSVDGETSVCDMVVIMANGLADNPGIVHEDDEYEKFKNALELVCASLARLIAKDGEGATKLIEVIAEGARSEQDAYKAVCAVSKSPLVKTAIFGEDANWGRIITAVGYSGAQFNPNSVDISLGNLMVCKDGIALKFDEGQAKKILEEKEVQIKINFNDGNFSDRMWTCDFSYDYVKINSSYRS
jgi:glutamate N-acetyltransferase/amino-acid N-acetyltransferase